MRRTILKIICIVSGVLFAIFSIFTVYSAILTFNTIAAAGIIGGADAPTMVFALRRAARSPVFSAAIAALFLFAGTGLALIFRRKPKK